MSSWAYYNEFDPVAAQWIRNLIKAGHIAPGEVDERSIEDVLPGDLRAFTQCHFFAGIGVWSYSLRRAGVADDRPVWSGSCPCQPFSTAGEGAGFADERHLWPAFHHLIKECRPELVVGEQVASKDADPWIDLVHTDLEAMDYAFGAVAFPSAGVGAPHIRDRLYWVANAALCGWREKRSDTGRFVTGDSSQGFAAGSVPSSANCGPGPTNGFWAGADWLGCTDGRWRPVEPGTQPLAHGVAGRVGLLRGYGNAVNAVQAQEFIQVVMQSIQESSHV